MRAALLALLVLGCGTSAKQRDRDNGPTGAAIATDQLEATAHRPPAPIEPVPSGGAPECDRARIRSCFGSLQKIAGAGRIGRKGVAGWQPGFEGKSATIAELSRPHFAMADAAGNIYIADKDAHAIRRVDVAGNIVTFAGTSAPGDDGDGPGVASSMRLSSPNGLWVSGDGTVYILDLGNGKVRRISTGGEMTTLFSVRGGISIGRGLWVSDDESRALVASNRRILEWQRGKATRVFASGFSSLGNIVVDPAGALVAADRGASRVYRVDADGTRQAIAGSGRPGGSGPGAPALDASLPGVRAVWFDGRGGMFLGTHRSSRVWYVGKDGLLQSFLDDKDVREVRGLSTDSRGNLIVVDDDRGFVHVVPRER